MKQVTLTDATPQPDRIFLLKASRKLEVGLFLLLMLLGFGVRLLDLTDLPFDFAATRQLHSLILSRGYYYEMDTPATNAIPADLRSFAINASKGEPIIEPPLMELLTANTYRLLGGENIIVPRLYSILFWMLGAVGLYLAARMITTRNGAFVAMAVYLFAPFGVIASRAFQPDPLMIATVCWALYFQLRWDKEDNWKNALLAGIFTGLTVFIKAIAVFFVGIPILGLVLNKGFKNWIKNPRVYVMAALSLVPAAIYNVISATVGGNASSIFGTRFFPNLFVQLEFYAGWSTLIRGAVGFGAFIISLISVLLIAKRSHRVFFICMWLGYLLYGLTVAYHISTHNYYHEPLFPIVSIGVGIFAGVVIDRIMKINFNWISKVLVWGMFLLLIAVNINEARGTLHAENYRPEKAFWEELGNKVGHNSRVIALTQDYGGRLSYFGYVGAQVWSSTGDFRLTQLAGGTNPELEQLVKEKTAGMDVFLVTDLSEFDKQAALKDYLLTHYEYQQGDGYYLFDLHAAVVP